MRTWLAALAFLCGVAGPASAGPAHDIAGAWSAQQQTDYEYPDYFRVDLVERDGRLIGKGVINLCNACRGFEEYAIDWEGQIHGDRVELAGTHSDRSFEAPVRFVGQVSADGQRIEGMLTQERRETAFIMLRGRNGAEDSGAAAESH